MFVQHDEYLINTSNINYIKLNENALRFMYTLVLLVKALELE